MTPDEVAIKLAEIALKNDAVKIGFPVVGAGLAAVVAAISAYGIAVLKYRNESNKSFDEERLKTLKEIIVKVNNYSSAIVKFSLLRRSKEEVQSPKEEETLLESEANLANCQGDLSLALALLSVLGEGNARKRLLAYEKKTMNYLHGLDSYSDRSHDLSSSEMADARLAFFSSLSSTYEGITRRK